MAFAIGALLSGIAALLAVGITKKVYIGLIVFIAGVLLLSGGATAFISTISLPKALIILVVLIIIFKLIGGKK